MSKPNYYQKRLRSYGYPESVVWEMKPGTQAWKDESITDAQIRRRQRDDRQRKS